MALQPRYNDEAQVILKVVEPDRSIRFCHRHILLTKNNPEVQIGRTTKRDARLVEGPNNGWFNSAVMSRNHAKLVLSPANNSVTLIDAKSLHGTYVNNHRIESGQPKELRSNDVLRFGIPILKGSDVFRSCEMMVTLNFGQSNPQERPAVFRVPDSTDDEDEMSEMDDTVETSVAILQQAGISPAQKEFSGSVSAIDLTGDDDSNAAEIVMLMEPGENSRELAMEPGPASAEIEASEQSAPWISEVDSLDEGSEGRMSSQVSNSSLELHSEKDGLSFYYEDTENCDHCDDEEGLGPDMEVFAVEETSHVSQLPLAEQPDLVSATYAEDVNPSCLAAASVEQAASSPSFRSSFDAQVRSAGVLGAKSGKVEYFEAREHNRRVCLGQTGGKQNSNENGADGPADMANDELELVASQRSLTEHVTARTCTTTADLLAAGDKFLHTPMTGVDTRPDTDPNELLDDTSAYTYEMSKRMAGLGTGPTLAASQNVEAEKAPGGSAKEACKDAALGDGSLKRKSDEISQLLPVEEDRDLVGKRFQPADGMTRSVDLADGEPTHAANASRQAAGSCAERPVKRMRRVAELLGFAAIGGVAVMSALIATAPDL